MATMQQIPIVMQRDNSHLPSQKIRYRKAIRGLAITELVIGAVCAVLGSGILISYSVANRYWGPTTGEGIYLGAMIAVAGGLGIGASGNNSPRCLLYVHMGFSIFATVCASALFGCSVPFTMLAYNGAAFGMYIVLTILAFTSIVLLVISAGVCCCAVPGCCEATYPQSGQPQVVYISTSGPPQGTMAGQASSSGATPVYYVMGNQIDPQMFQNIPGASQQRPSPAHQPVHGGAVEVSAESKTSPEQLEKTSNLDDPMDVPPAYTSKEELE